MDNTVKRALAGMISGIIAFEAWQRYNKHQRLEERVARSRKLKEQANEVPSYFEDEVELDKKFNDELKEERKQ